MIVGMRVLLALVLVLLLAAAGTFFVAGRVAGPAIDLRQPAAVLGRTGSLEVVARAPGAHLSRLDVTLEQEGRSYPLFALPGGAESKILQDGEDGMKVTRRLASRDLKGLRSGPARITVHAARPVLFGLRTVEARAARDIQVRLEPPRVTVLSRFHFVNHGGSEVVVYRATPADVESGVRVGDRAYPGFPASGAGIADADGTLRVAFFALLHDQDLATPMTVYARDAAGNQARATFDLRVIPKPFRRSRIEVDDAFLGRVVPAILEQTPDLAVDDPNDAVKAFLAVNGPLRRKNAQTIEGLARKTAPKVLWEGPFAQLGNSAVQSSFADHRTYFYKGREIDQQVHLGFDLAVTASVPVSAANRGTVVFADYLGIYGNCVILDHGMGVQSLYAHLSSIGVTPGDAVEKGQELGRSGTTGLAGGDHLHFTMLVGGHPVTPVDWWSGQWIEDRILRKFREAGAPAAAAQ